MKNEIKNKHYYVIFTKSLFGHCINQIFKLFLEQKCYTNEIMTTIHSINLQGLYWFKMHLEEMLYVQHFWNPWLFTKTTNQFAISSQLDKERRIFFLHWNIVTFLLVSQQLPCRRRVWFKAFKAVQYEMGSKKQPWNLSSTLNSSSITPETQSAARGEALVLRTAWSKVSIVVSLQI